MLVPRPISPQQDEIVRRLFEQFALTPLVERLFAQLSTGEQRLVLLVRSLVKSPPLLILDEPFQGLDRRTIHLARNWLDTQLRRTRRCYSSAIMRRRFRRTVDRTLKLNAGRATE